MTENDMSGLILVRSDTGDGGWSLHPESASTEDITEGRAFLLSGTARKTKDGEWDRPNARDIAKARRLIPL